MKREFVVAVYIVKDNEVLLHWHKKSGRWLPPGGHIEENELPDEAAIREVKEEVGLEIELIGKKAKGHPKQNAKGLFTPMLVQLEDIPQRNDEPEHQHIDLIYAAQPKSTNITDGRWMRIENMKREGIEEEIIEHSKIAIEAVKEK